MDKISNSQHGFTIIEALVSVLISAIVTGGVFYTYTVATSSYHDLAIREIIHDNSVAVLSIIGKEMKMIGNGIPFDQANFQILDTLEDSAAVDYNDPAELHPIVITGDDAATATYLQYKLNETGNIYYVVGANFVPTSNLTLALNTVSGLFEGDTVFFSNALSNQDDGLVGVIDEIDVSAKTITLENDFKRSPNATFPIGSTMEPVASIELKNDSGNIVRNSGFGDVILAKGASFSLEYLNKSGTALTLPLTSADIRNNLGSVRVTITLSSTEKHKYFTPLNGEFILSRSQIFALRSFNFTG